MGLRWGEQDLKVILKLSDFFWGMAPRSIFGVGSMGLRSGQQRTKDIFKSFEFFWSKVPRSISSGEYGSARGAAGNEGHLEVVCVLLEQGAALNIISKWHSSVLRKALYGGHLAVVSVLLEHALDVNTEEGIYGVHSEQQRTKDVLKLFDFFWSNIQGGEYGSALGAAAYEGHLEVVRLLLDQGATLNIPSTRYGSVLGAAAYGGHLAVVSLLLEKGLDVNIEGGNYGSALRAAAHESHLDVVRLLLEKGADIIMGNYGSALGTAASGGNLEIVRLLLDQVSRLGTRVEGGWLTEG
jgi:ankyrin repeat protein